MAILPFSENEILAGLINRDTTNGFIFLLIISYVHRVKLPTRKQVF